MGCSNPVPQSTITVVLPLVINGYCWWEGWHTTNGKYAFRSSLRFFGWSWRYLDVVVVVACYRKLYIFCIESRRYLPNTHNNKHHEYVLLDEDTRFCFHSVCSRCRLETTPPPNRRDRCWLLRAFWALLMLCCLLSASLFLSLTLFS